MVNLTKRQKCAFRKQRDICGNFIKSKYDEENNQNEDGEEVEFLQQQPQLWIEIGEDEIFDTEDNNFAEVMTNNNYTTSAAEGDVDENEELLKNMWKETDLNQILAYARRGESRTTDWRKRKFAEYIQKDAKSSHKMSEYFKPKPKDVPVVDCSEEDSNDEEETSDVECEKIRLEKQGKHIEETDANMIEALHCLEENAESCIPTNLREEKLIADLSKYEFLQFVCIKSYFSKRFKGEGKMKASSKVAQVIFNSSAENSYRARTIREWANYYLRPCLGIR